MYALLTGPLLWLSLLVFFIGSLFRIIQMFRLAKKEKVIYPYMTVRHSLRSIIHWIVPFAGRNMRLRPFMTIATFAFHLSLFAAPLFLVAHNVILDARWGVSLWVLPETVADVLTLIVIAVCVFFFVRRMFAPEVLYVTSWGDVILLVLIALPFVTGFIAHHQFFASRAVLIAHIILGEIMLMLVPFTRLSHMLYFFFTRAYMGCEFGNVRNSRDW
ncbi:MAG: nitrate reductase [Deltaproteobacteria bacterium]|nr:nitrate reductase [Deltaproteobacteria bacterium]